MSNSLLLKVIVNGAHGKMGIEACKTIQKHPDFQLVASLGHHDDLAETIINTQADIVIDLTSAESVYENSLMIIKHGASPVIGTSGLLEEHIQALKARCAEKKLGGIIVPNFSISAVLMMRFAAEAARWLPEVEIIEAHHPQKLDAPSATSIKTAELIASARCLPKAKLPLKEQLPGARGATHRDINIHALRLPGILAQQQVIFGSIGETLTLTHNTIDRSSFMPGLILACQQVRQLDGLYYGLEHVLESN